MALAINLGTGVRRLVSAAEVAADIAAMPTPETINRATKINYIIAAWKRSVYGGGTLSDDAMRLLAEMAVDAVAKAESVTMDTDPQTTRRDWPQIRADLRLRATATARDLLPIFNTWYIASQNGTNVRGTRRLEADLWAKVAEHRLLIATDEILVGRWIAETIGGKFEPSTGVVINE